METPKRSLSNIPDADLEAVLQDSPTVGICERFYKCNGERTCELMTMCIGLKSHDGRTLGDATLEPYASMKFRKKVAPTQKHMVEEIKRRARVQCITPLPACRYWTREKLVQWLEANPVSEPADVCLSGAQGEEAALTDQEGSR